MDKTEIITGSESLSRQISQLKAERAAQEEALTQSFNDLKQLIFYPAKNIKIYSNNLPSRKRELINLSKIVLNMGTDYILEQSFGKRQKLNDFLTAVMIELISIPLINRGITKLFTGIDKYLFGETASND
ncbi:MAG: hypothetical protein JXR22_10680 [Prolixibacteraceae bacterium]|nr:hypothetical protein [Prolixibacteraceae bacterium]